MSDLVERLRDHARFSYTHERGTADLLRAAAAAITELADALRFYRDAFQKHYKRGPTGLDHSEWKPTAALLEDCGERARAALAKLEATPE